MVGRKIKEFVDTRYLFAPQSHVVEIWFDNEGVHFVCVAGPRARYVGQGGMNKSASSTVMPVQRLVTVELHNPGISPPPSHFFLYAVVIDREFEEEKKQCILGTRELYSGDRQNSAINYQHAATVLCAQISFSPSVTPSSSARSRSSRGASRGKERGRREKMH